MRHAYLLPAAALLALLSGCAGLKKDTVQFSETTACAKQSAATLLAAQSQLGPASDTRALACALDTVRGSTAPALRRSALGSRLCLLLAERETGADRREKLAAEGVSLAEAALALGADGDGAVHYYLATNLGLAVRDHITLAMDNLKRLESEMKRAVALNPDIDDGGPLRVLGTLYLKAPAWPNGIGDRDKALELLAQAAHSHTGHPLNHLFYAQALWEDDDEAAMAQAKNEYAQGLKLLREGQWGYSLAPWQKEFDEFGQEIGWAAGPEQAALGGREEGTPRRRPFKKQQLRLFLVGLGDLR
ncbi:MAG: sterol transporter outer membrane protein BstC, partial [Candidatus Methylumidiphilus sp.]